MSNTVDKVFKFTPPDGEPFMVAAVKTPDGYVVTSNRAGKWAAEPNIDVADLIMPEQRFAEWDVEEIRPPEAA